MPEQVKIGNILFLDIETVPAYPAFQEAPGQIQRLWVKYCQRDLITTTQIMLKFKGQEFLAPEDLIVLEEH